MPTRVPVVGQTYTFGIVLYSQDTPYNFATDPAIASADFRLSVNGGAFAVLTNTPTATPTGDCRVEVTISAAETTAAGDGGELFLVGHDPDDSWQDVAYSLRVYDSDIPVPVEVADALLARDIGSGSGAGTLDERTVRAALRFLRNKWSLSGGTLTVTKEDDTTAAWTAAVTSEASADPITAVDPTDA